MLKTISMSTFSTDECEQGFILMNNTTTDFIPSVLILNVVSLILILVDQRL
jgi:hypothetical protein